MVGRRLPRGGGRQRPGRTGKRARLLTRGRLPYTLTWELECIEAVPPTRLDSRIDGDFVGRGIWTITPLADRVCKVVLEWNVEVRKPLVRNLTPVLRPLFRWNHSWAMKRGEQRMQALLDRITRSGRRLTRDRGEAVAKAFTPVR